MAYKQLKLWFDQDLGILLANRIKKDYPLFDTPSFIRDIETGVDALELKARVALIATLLEKYLPSDFETAVQLLVNNLGPENTAQTGMFKFGYWVMPIAKFVEVYGLANFDSSMWALEEITKRNTSEYAIRPFIEKYPDKTMDRLQEWSTNPNFHIRRLASEGPRPRLPWATKLPQFIEDPSPILPILSNLKDDSIKYVQKSVANCINDILKDNYDLGIELLAHWSKDASPQRRWIIRHALRNLKKQADAKALSILNGL